MTGNFTVYVHIIRPGPPSNKAMIADLPVFNDREKATKLAQKIVDEYNEHLIVNGITGAEHQLDILSRFDNYFYSINPWTHLSIFKRITDKRYKVHITPDTPDDEAERTPRNRPRISPLNQSYGRLHDMRDKDAMKYICDSLENWVRKGGWGHKIKIQHRIIPTLVPVVLSSRAEPSLAFAVKAQVKYPTPNITLQVIPALCNNPQPHYSLNTMSTTTTADLPTISITEEIDQDPFDFLADDEPPSDEETDVSETADASSDDDWTKQIAEWRKAGQGLFAYKILTNPAIDTTYHLPIFETLQEATLYAAKIVLTFKDFVFTQCGFPGQGEEKEFPHKRCLLQPCYDLVRRGYYVDLSKVVGENSRLKEVYVRVLQIPAEEIQGIEEGEFRDPFNVGGILWYKLLREAEWIDVEDQVDLPDIGGLEVE
ncbi:hypothetical protein BZA77DRAFT_292727 [Pyronema omphalodes]|nr:hypothetical protein BZA77DRAFT_292727 [Pyronema omphalodes]